MLVLSRKSDQSVFISDNIIVTVLSIHGDRVRLGIEAPREIAVHRQNCMRGYRTGTVRSVLGRKAQSVGVTQIAASHWEVGSITTRCRQHCQHRL